MFKKIMKFIKKIIVSMIIIFAYNKISFSLNAMIPINLITIILVSFFGIPAIIMLVVFYLLVL